ncbi:YggS family pyridoxal phosphate-dependent enzyme [Actinocrinis puniceicyclus]|uniref:Pyridoxal phosphate homeostasis protein n=1 Tax=Actinocrinis puniceicyclus TaxID=977794 RepID=A0A8J7WR73_9ACTN|nr:YggS family pyridoxal phosphate-dependent enzyme [Actinocrinis puniceicyclus]MBS2964065.1 YggS family pyridoxal phosphate-dependent enzyme [Actinocrinis puniceicyclus]
MAESYAGSGPEDQRAAQLAENLNALRTRLDAACAAAHRAPGAVALVAVTKFFPATDVLRLLRLGLREFGENRDQEAADKAARVAGALRGPQHLDLAAPRWHFIGQLQTNKARSVVSYADVIESVDRLRLVAALDRAAERAGRAPTCLIQVNLDPDPGAGADADGRGGAAPGEVERIADAVAGSPALRLGGLMAVAPLGADPRPAFERLAELHAKVLGTHPEAVSLSAGMSGDLEAAVAAGATHVRIGSALLGSRAPLR